MASEMKRFVGKSAVVTGGASGIGLAIAERLRKEGARVCVWDRDNAPSDSLAGASEIQSIQLDITDHAAVAAAAKQTVAFFGAIDVLVCSAGVAGANATTWDYSIEEWKKVFDINVHGLFFCNRAVVPHMMERNYGRIVNIASIAGKEGNPNASPYSAAKAGVIAVTKSLAKEHATSGVLINCITPAMIETEILKQLTQAHIDFMTSKIPMGRPGQPSEVAALATFLCSEETSFSTGAAFDLSGGRATY